MVKYSSQTRKALDYLLKTPSQKRVYLLGLDLSKREFWDSFKPKPLEEDEVTVPYVLEVLGICYRTFEKYEKRGFFGEVKDNLRTIQGHLPRLVKSSRVEEIQKIFAYMIPVFFFREMLKREKRYCDILRPLKWTASLVN